MAYFYTYIDPREIEAQFAKTTDEDDEDDKGQLQKTEVEMAKRDSVKSHDEDKTVAQTKMWTTSTTKQTWFSIISIMTLCLNLYNDA